MKTHTHRWQYMEPGPIVKFPSQDRAARFHRFICECGRTKLIENQGEINPEGEKK